MIIKVKVSGIQLQAKQTAPKQKAVEFNLAQSCLSSLSAVDKMDGVDPSMAQSSGCNLGVPVDGLFDDP